MKKLKLMLILLCVGMINVKAQDVTEALKMYNFQKYTSAIKILEPLSATNAEANYYLGLSYLGMENNVKAKEIFQKNADDAANMSGIARILFLEGKKDEAMSILEKVVTKAKRKDVNPFIYAADAITNTYVGNPMKALEWYEKAKELKETAPILIGMGDANRLIQGGGGKAMNHYANAELLGTHNSLVAYKRGNLWYAAKGYDSALACYKRASDLDPQNPLPYSDLANAYYNIGKYEIAKENIEKYLKLSDNSADDQLLYANILYLSKDYSAAISKMNELVANNNDKPYIHRLLGYSYFETGDISKAKTSMDNFFAKQEKSKIIPKDYYYYAKILMKDSTKKNEANVYFEKGIATDTAKDKTTAYRDLAESFKDSKEYLTAANWYNKITTSNSPNVLPLDYWWKGIMYYYIDKDAEAASAFNEMVSKYPDEPTGHFWQGRIAALKDKDYTNGAALPYYEKWLTLLNGNESNQSDLKKAYTYMASVAINTNKKDKAKLYCDKLLSFDPNDATAKKILGFIK